MRWRWRRWTLNFYEYGRLFYFSRLVRSLFLGYDEGRGGVHITFLSFKFIAFLSKGVFAGLLEGVRD
jgi:hypothetical protein